MLVVGRDPRAGVWVLHNSWGARPKEPKERTSTPDLTLPHHVVVTDEWFAEHCVEALVPTCVHEPPRTTRTIHLAHYELLATCASTAGALARPLLLPSLSSPPSASSCSHAPCARSLWTCLLPRLPTDVARHVGRILAITTLQRRIRRHRVRHCEHPMWPLLRAMLLARLDDASDLDVLASCDWVRREWRTEPMSWLFMLHREPKQLQVILDEDLADTT
jgi:hypothetical protein